MTLSGSCTALITPFRDGRIDEPALRRLVEFQIAEGTAALVPCGTTGEAATMTGDEIERVIAIVAEAVNGRVPVVAGTGGNCTATTIERTRRARALGADAALVVAPYYNKPTQEGLFAHFTAVADEGGLPVLLYNVPGRTSVNVLPETVLRLASHPGIIGVKEASGSLDQASQIVREAPDGFAVLSGDDSLTLPMLSVGGQGVVSVASNIAPGAVAALAAAGMAGDFATARRLHLELFDLFRALFVETNPVPVKTAAAMLGLCAPDVRLPLVPLTEASQRRLESALAACALLREAVAA
ncbi:MAG: 4-hydroxy-tetrahydrodipicolinate synthase [Thermomicrobiales bacterium]|nr:4-hydroxy-tetrahydrodipicolinate synthase [Thermomicrobiales bacterium]